MPIVNLKIHYEMNINWNVKSTGGLTICSYAFSDVRRLVNDIRESGTVDFVVRHDTKTSLDIELSCPKDDSRDCFAVAHIPPGAEKFKFHERRISNIFDGKVHVRKLFKLTKTQGLEELKEYLSLILQQLIPDQQDLSVNLFLYKVPELAA